MLDKMILSAISKLLEAPIGNAAIFAFLFWKIFKFYREDITTIVRQNTEALIRLSEEVEEHTDAVLERESRKELHEKLEKSMKRVAEERGFKVSGE